MPRAIYQHRTDYILDGATMSSSGAALMSSYSLATLLTLNPAARVRFSGASVTVTFTLGSSKRADLFLLPVSNLAGSVLTLTNGNGLSQAITLPAMPLDNIPLTAIVDLTIGTPNAATRTSNVWNLVIVSNPANVILGGAVWLGTPNRTFDRNFLWGGSIKEEHMGNEETNEYGSDYCVDYETRRRWIECTFKHATDLDRDALKAWSRANHGRWLPSPFWPDPGVNDGLLGRWPRVFEEEFTFLNLNSVPLTFNERSKGKPVA